MAQYLDSDSLIRSIKRRAMIPESQNTFSESDFLELANEEVSMGIVPTILRHHEDYLMFSEEVTLESGKVRYTIPYRAIGNKLRELSFKDSGGNIYEMTRIPIDDLPDFNGSYTTSRAYVYYVENNEIVLVNQGTPSLNGSLVFTYYLRPNDLVSTNRVGVITNISDNGTDTVITISSFPDNFSSLAEYDFIKSKSPHRTLGINKTPNSVSTTNKTLTFSSSDKPTNLAVGDHIALAEETIIPQIPGDLHVMLAHRVAARCLEAIGDTQGLQTANLKLAELEKNTGALIDNRVEASPQKVVNRHSILRNGLARGKFRYRGD